MEADLLSFKVSPLETARSSRNSGTRSNPQRRPRPGKATNPIPVDDDDRNDDDEEEDLPQLPQAKRRAAETSSSKNGRPLFLPPSEVNGGCSAGGSLGALPVGFNFGEALRVLGGSAKAKDDANFGEYSSLLCSFEGVLIPGIAKCSQESAQRHYLPPCISIAYQLARTRQPDGYRFS